MPGSITLKLSIAMIYDVRLFAKALHVIVCTMRRNFGKNVRANVCPDGECLESTHGLLDCRTFPVVSSRTIHGWTEC